MMNRDTKSNDKNEVGHAKVLHEEIDEWLEDEQLFK